MAVVDQEIGRGLLITGELDEGATTITTGILPSGKTQADIKSWAALAAKGDTVIVSADMVFSPAGTGNQRIAGTIAAAPNIPGGADPYTADEADPAVDRTATIEAIGMYTRLVTLDASGGTTVALSVQPSSNIAGAWEAVAANDESYVLVAGALSTDSLVLFGFGGNFA